MSNQNNHTNPIMPRWMTEAGLTTLKDGYLLPGEGVYGMFRRIASSAARQLAMPEMEEQFYGALTEGLICLASPILSNMGTDRGLPISCFGQMVGDDMFQILNTLQEFAMLSKYGGGVSQYFGGVRPAGAAIRGGLNGTSNGSVAFAKLWDTAVTVVSQGTVRRGANAFYWPANHGDRTNALRIRRPSGSVHMQCLESNHGFIFDDATMQRVVDGNKEDRDFWAEVIKTRIETGEPYIMFGDAANRHQGDFLRRVYERHGLKNLYSNICTEILLPTDLDHTFVCCISSLPIHRYHEWSGKGVVRLDAVLDEFIEKASKIPGFERAVRFAKKSRAIGIGALGYHSFLQNEGLAFNSPEAMEWNRRIFKEIREEAEAASRELAVLRGEPEWCAGEGRRNTHLMAIAPTATNSIISGHVSPGIEPWSANLFAHKTAKGSFMLRNPALERVLDGLGKNNDETWKDINANGGSVQHLGFLSEHLKKVFLTAYEMDMRDLVRAAAGRGDFIDQGQSLNMFFQPPQKEADPKAWGVEKGLLEFSGGVYNLTAKGTELATKDGRDPTREKPESIVADLLEKDFGRRQKAWWRYVNDTHMLAWRSGLKTLYYCRNKASTKADLASRGHQRKDIIGSKPAEPAPKADDVQAKATELPVVSSTKAATKTTAAPEQVTIVDEDDNEGCKSCEG